jgi:predicted dehydrogenase
VVRVAVFGLGQCAEEIDLPACERLPEVNVVAACDPAAARRHALGTRFGIRNLYADPETLLAREKPELVVVATPPDTHHNLCLLALRNGAHVFCEKPFVRDVAEADDVIQVAEQERLAVGVNNEYRFMPIYRVPQEAIARGDYGAPFFIQCWQQMYHPPSREQNWRGQLVQSTLYEFGTHPLDLISFFFDALPLSISAHMPRPDPDIEADAIVQATLRFPGERLAVLSLNRLSHAIERYLEMRIDCARASLRISFGGLARLAFNWSRPLGRPLLRASLVRGGEARVEAGGRSQAIARERSDGRGAATAANLRSLIQAMREGRASTESARHARELLRIVAAGYESARTGEVLWLVQHGT